MDSEKCTAQQVIASLGSKHINNSCKQPLVLIGEKQCDWWKEGVINGSARNNVDLWSPGSVFDELNGLHNDSFRSVLHCHRT